MKARLMRAGSALARVLPRRVAVAIARAAGDACWLLLGRRRRTLDDNLARLAPGDPPRRRRSRETFRNLARCSVDLLRMPHLSRAGVLDLVDCHGWHHLDAALAGGRGAILVTAHLGNWDLAGVCVAAAGYPTSTVVEAADRRAAGVYARVRGATGLAVLPLGDGMLSAYRVLERGELLVLVGDRAIGGRGQEVAFGRGRRPVSRGPAALARRARAPVLTGYVVLHPNGAGRPYLGVIEPPIDDESAGDPEELTRRIAARLEAAIRRFPEQWFVFQPAWAADTAAPAGRRAS